MPAAMQDARLRAFIRGETTRAPVAYFLRRFRRLRSQRSRYGGGLMKRINRRLLLKGAAAGGAIAATEAVTGFPTVWAQNQGHHAGPCRRLVFGDQRDRRSGDQGPRLHGRDAGDHRRRAAQPLADPAEHHRHQQHRRHIAALLSSARASLQPIPVEQVQVVGQDGAALHQGRVSRTAGGLDPGPSRPSRCSSTSPADGKKFAAQADRVADRDPDHVQRRHARHPARSRSAATDRRAGRTCSTPNSRARRRSSTSRRSASWTSRWRSRRAATSSTATRAT